MKRYLTYTILCLISLGIIVSCNDDRVPELKGTIDRVGEEQIIVVHYYDSERDVTDAYLTHMGDQIGDDPDAKATRLGWSTWPEGKCEIHVVKVRTKEHIKTLGHEMLHCIKGGWH